MMLFLNIKKSAHMLDKFISYKAKHTLDCLRKYSLEKFKYVQKYKELRILIAKIYIYDLDELFSGVDVMRTNRERYIMAIQEIINS